MLLELKPTWVQYSMRPQGLYSMLTRFFMMYSRMLKLNNMRSIDNLT